MIHRALTFLSIVSALLSTSAWAGPVELEALTKALISPESTQLIEKALGNSAVMSKVFRFLHRAYIPHAEILAAIETPEGARAILQRGLELARGDETLQIEAEALLGRQIGLDKLVERLHTEALAASHEETTHPTTGPFGPEQRTKWSIGGPASADPAALTEAIKEDKPETIAAILLAGASPLEAREDLDFALSDHGTGEARRMIALAKTWALHPQEVTVEELNEALARATTRGDRATAHMIQTMLDAAWGEKVVPILNTYLIPGEEG